MNEIKSASEMIATLTSIVQNNDCPLDRGLVTACKDALATIHKLNAEIEQWKIRMHYMDKTSQLIRQRAVSNRKGKK